jgi:hypothetical protein
MVYSRFLGYKHSKSLKCGEAQLKDSLRNIPVARKYVTLTKK